MSGMLTPGDRLEVEIEKPAAGGRMIARHDGQIVLVSGAIPGERVDVVIERVDKRLAFATAAAILTPSPVRRPSAADPLCGGCLYSHIDPARQRELKAAIVADAFARIGKHPLSETVPVAVSPEHGYRTRARLHVKDGRVGFYREGTHDLCDAAATGQLATATLPAIELVVAALAARGLITTAVEVAESLAGDQRALHLAIAGGPKVPADLLEPWLGPDVVAITVSTQAGDRTTAGAASISDPLDVITSGRAAGELRRRPESFFQANRFLVPELVSGVIDNVLPDGDVLDLYAGVGLFAVALAAVGRSGVTAVEGDAASGADLVVNAGPLAPRLTAVVASVESHLARRRELPHTVIVDPPRTGLSKAVLAALVTGAAHRILYVSCDPPTMARDARGLLDGGYALRSLRAFDLFPNTPHVEVLAVFERNS